MSTRMWAVDLEGNGASPPEIVEIAIVELRGVDLTGLSKCWRLKPAGGISAMASRIHGIWKRDVEHAPEWEDVADDILMWIEGTPIVGHNVRVEYDVLSRMFEDWNPPAAIDTLRLSRKLLPNQEKYGLGRLGESLGLHQAAQSATGASSHSALYDAVLAAMLLNHLLMPLTEEARKAALADADILNVSQGTLL
jgi:DNA polymerase-3 subunit epsilon